jgi:hypothetical protein
MFTSCFLNNSSFQGVFSRERMFNWKNAVVLKWIQKQNLCFQVLVFLPIVVVVIVVVVSFGVVISKWFQ